MTATLIWEIETAHGPASYGLMLSATWQPNGRSLRWWLHCSCGKRSCILYQNRAEYACRRCLRLLYPSQCLSPQRRAEYRAAKLLARVHSDPHAPVHRKPRRMHQHRFEAIVREATDCRRTAEALRERVRSRRWTGGHIFRSDLSEERRWHE